MKKSTMTIYDKPTQSRSQSPLSFWSAARMRTLAMSDLKVRDSRISGRFCSNLIN